MKRKFTRSIVFLLIFAFLTVPILTIVPVEEADAWIRHGCCVKECTKSFWGIKITYCCKSEVYWHLSPFWHPWSCP